MGGEAVGHAGSPALASHPQRPHQGGEGGWGCWGEARRPGMGALCPPGTPAAPQPCVGCFDSAPGAELRQTTPHWTPFKLLQALKLRLEPERKY